MDPINNTRILGAQYASNHVLTVDNFKQDTVQLDTALQAGEILVRTLYLSLDPITRLSFNDPHAKVLTLNQVITGFGLGEVIESKDPDFPRGAIVLGSNLPWESVSRIISNKADLSAIEDARNPKFQHQVVDVSSAAGPAGTFFAILAKCEGAFVVGSAGSDDKVQYLLENIGLDAGFNYKTQDARAELAKAAPPQGLDFAVAQHLHRYPDFWADVKPRVENGQIKVQDTIVVGLEDRWGVVDYMNGVHR
ncbi:hypothetical protein BGZ81_004736 [Podila clonocystis]|nr:hypothetical protein BGZ81_004736 [Podila clonocystis]